MRIRLTQITISMITAILMVSSIGCPMISSDAGLPVMFRENVKFPVPADSLKYPLVTPTEEEEKGVLLRYKAQSDKYKYNSIFIMFSDIVENKGYKQAVQKSSEIVRFLPAPDGINLIRENETKWALASLCRRSLINSRGEFLRSIEIKPTGLEGETASLAEGDQFSSFENVSAGFGFPEDAIKIGQTGTSVIGQRWERSVQESKILWQLLGFSEVKGRRCAVFHYTGTGETKTQVESTNKILIDKFEQKGIFYFDYERGFEVEYLIWCTGERPLLRHHVIPGVGSTSKYDEEPSKYATFWQSSLAK